MVQQISQATCHLCGGKEFSTLVDLGRLPISHSYLEPSCNFEETFQYIVHTCQSCNLPQILNPISPEKLYGEYNFCFTSWKPEPHRNRQVRLIEELSAGPKVLEIGCNDGTFLNDLKSAGFSECVGVEPNPVAADLARKSGLEVYQKLLSSECSSEILRSHGLFDNIVSRHVIEHITDLNEFFICVGMLLKPGGIIMLDAPECSGAIEMGDASILWEEHVNYFSEDTLQGMLTGFGYEMIDMRRYLFTGESLSAIARKKVVNINQNVKYEFSLEQDDKHLQKVYEQYSVKQNKFGTDLRDCLAERKRAGQVIVLFGIGARGVMTVNALHLESLIDVIFDDQIEKQGKCAPGTKLVIQNPESIRKASGPITCLLAVNNENEESVISRIRGLTKQKVTFSSLLSPKDIWSELELLR